MDLKKTRVDVDRATEGVWVDLDSETRLKIAQWLNPRHRAHVQKALEPHKRALRMETMDDKLMDKLEVQGIAETVLVGWEGLVENGEEIAYSTDEAVRLLSDPELKWFRDFVREQADDLSNFRNKVEEEEVDAVGKP